ncbi:MAG: hypothetical protein ACRD00_02505, partial [Thermoanaerobaculia bacterium]
MILDVEAAARWLEALLRTPDDIADIFVEERRDTILEWRDAEVAGVRVVADAGLSARWRRGREQRLVFETRADDAGAREAVR